ncbi:hypothetical protein HanXRQr2_Chr13g0597851 [Helianthus annuus]|uniref:Uncharacterized protein n=1 Tax=Helianthus annuus TaxID=4232 RepID=A0A9K3EI54_HELAN|nr:hypothetical protein HanXRQr2_Chr13g0597851 [Helianthus annuus]KAJ0477606.1 hypothetical protein HanHA300_Chr13g0490461 [Helianthus annuus]KAJ0482129.1 hypothetical protein HanIR_Chr13g0650411 [Helianthus annuus]KAJ0498437.1 hypothetical protein HanHA89_Chr13g0522591 [Helianthus annuus]KAJ0664450.1 hypothetical protein HanLR1_Chr13g0492551 [Helianthus annuus]
MRRLLSLSIANSSSSNSRSAPSAKHSAVDPRHPVAGSQLMRWSPAAETAGNEREMVWRRRIVAQIRSRSVDFDIFERF